MRLGAHMSVSGGKYKAFERGRELGCETIQVFIRNVRGWSSKPLEQEEIDDFIKKKEETEGEIWPVISHNSYLVNLASLDKEKLEKSYNAMLDELTKVDQLQIEYENMHPGVIPIGDKNEITKLEALTQIADQLNNLMEVTKSSKVIILLETTAGQGKGLGNKFLNDLSRANVLLHIVDITGSLDKFGKKVGVGENDPYEDVLFLENEINLWYEDIIRREDWSKFIKTFSREKKKFIEELHKRVSGLKIKKLQVINALKNSNLEEKNPAQWTDEEIFNFSKALREISKPILIIANKIDKEISSKNLTDLKINMKEL